eukprot:12419006-Karenia_brevis.AAC.2
MVNDTNADANVDAANADADVDAEEDIDADDADADDFDADAESLMLMEISGALWDDEQSWRRNLLGSPLGNHWEVESRHERQLRVVQLVSDAIAPWKATPQLGKAYLEKAREFFTKCQ